jgi:drug/metabolite transporter (DMT)-like permease
VLALSSAFLFGASAPVAKLLLGITDPQLLAGLLYLGSGVGLAMVTAAGRSLGLERPEAPLRPQDLPWLAAIVLFGGMLGPAMLMLGLTLTQASTGALLLNTEGLATMAIAWLIFRENVDRRIFLGAMAILAGAVLLSWPDGGTISSPFHWGSALISPCLPSVGHRQQSHTEAECGRPAAARYDQGTGGWCGQFRAGISSWRAVARGHPGWGSGRGRVSRLRC